MPLDRATADRLIKLLGLTGSTFDGEALTAARKANALIKAAGMTWVEVFAAGQGADSPKVERGWREPVSWREAVWLCLELDDAPLTEWDRNFLSNIATRAELTERQQAQLDRIVAACREYARMAA